jgi:hypothetical protein
LGLVREIYAICQKNDTKLLVANISPQGGSPMFEFCKKHGIMAVDISFPWTREMTNYPHDPHPGPSGHKKYAEKLVPALKEILRN